MNSKTHDFALLHITVAPLKLSHHFIHTGIVNFMSEQHGIGQTTHTNEYNDVKNLIVCTFIARRTASI